jgi:MFS family permease
VPPSPSADQHPARLILILALAPAIGVGLCRFAYSLVLPDMRDSLGWSYSLAGFMNTVNAAGYLSGALVASWVIRRTGLFRTVWVGTLVCIVSLALSAVSANEVVLSLVRFASGVAGAVSFVAASALATNIAQAHPARLGFLTGLLYTGPGTGIFISGLTAPFLLQALGPGSWWVVWGVLAAIAAVLGLALPLARAAPERTPEQLASDTAPISPMLIYLIGYFLYGAGSIAYMTFMIAFVRDLAERILDHDRDRFFHLAEPLGGHHQPQPRRRCDGHRYSGDGAWCADSIFCAVAACAGAVGAGVR